MLRAKFRGASRTGENPMSGSVYEVKPTPPRSGGGGFTLTSKKRDSGCFCEFFPLRDYFFWLQIRNFSWKRSLLMVLKAPRKSSLWG